MTNVEHFLSFLDGVILEDICRIKSLCWPCYSFVFFWNVCRTYHLIVRKIWSDVKSREMD
jgi:hypothetical protein